MSFPNGEMMTHPVCSRRLSRGSAGKVVAGGLLAVAGGLGGTVVYSGWDPKFRTTVEKNVPYSNQLFGMVLGPVPAPVVKKPVSKRTAGMGQDLDCSPPAFHQRCRYRAKVVCVFVCVCVHANSVFRPRWSPSRSPPCCPRPRNLSRRPQWRL